MRKKAKSSGPSSISDRQERLSPGSAGLAIVAVGSILGLLSPLGAVPAVAGPFLVAFGAIIAAPEAALPGRYIRSWWRLTAVGAFVCLAGLGIWFLSEPAGTAIVIVGSLLAAYSCAFGFRPRA